MQRRVMETSQPRRSVGELVRGGRATCRKRQKTLQELDGVAAGGGSVAVAWAETVRSGGTTKHVVWNFCFIEYELGPCVNVHITYNKVSYCSRCSGRG